MKILLINKYHFLRGGAERAYLDMGEILTQAGHEVAYFAMQDSQNLSTPWSRFFVTAVDYHREQSLWQKLRVALRILWNHEANKKLDAESIKKRSEDTVFDKHSARKKARPIGQEYSINTEQVDSSNYQYFIQDKQW